MTDNNTSTPESVGQDNARIPHHLVQLMMLAGRAGYVHEQMPSPTGRFDAFIADNHAFVMGEAGGAFTIFFRTLADDDKSIVISNSMEGMIRAMALIFARRLRALFQYDALRDFSGEIEQTPQLIEPAGSFPGVRLHIPARPGMSVLLDDTFWTSPAIAEYIKSFDWTMQDLFQALGDPFARPLQGVLEPAPQNLPADKGLSPFFPAETGEIFGLIADGFQAAGGETASYLHGKLLRFSMPDSEEAFSLWVYGDRRYIWVDKKDAEPVYRPTVLVNTLLDEVILRALGLLIGPWIRRVRGLAPLQIPEEPLDAFFQSEALSPLEDIVTASGVERADVLVANLKNEDGSARFFTVQQLINTTYVSPGTLIEAFLDPTGGALNDWVNSNA